ncbi:MAG TPA: M1 family aminopeptidase [Verrucomicrobiae bacterium]|nr:M1 family aminopeptidase [Verrucomicrobiae bacterium]
MFWTFFWFELRLRFRSISTYVFFLIPFLMMFFTVSVSDFGPISAGKVLLNGPYALLMSFVQYTAFGVILIAAIFGPTMLRDFQQDTYALIFTKPIKKFDYLGGKWLASFVVTVFIFSGLVFGGMLGGFMPWADKTRIAPIHLAWFLKPFLDITVANIFFVGALLFCVAALSRRIIVVYLQGVTLFALYLILFISVVTTNKLDRFWASVADPLTLIWTVSATRYWTAAERNSKLLEWSGTFLYNRLLWIAVGLVALAITYFFFPMSAEILTGKRANRKAKEAAEAEEQEKKARPKAVAQLPAVTQTFSSRTTWLQLLSMTRIRVWNIVREIPFWAIALLMVIFCAINGHFAGEVSDVKVWPVTYLMLNVLQGGGSLFLYIVLVLYAGELLWRERDVRFEQIHEALPQKDWTDWLSKLVALAVVELLLLTIVMIVGVVSQAIAGFYRVELFHYLIELYLIWLPQLLMIAILALFVHTVVSNKFVGHALVIGFVVLIPILYRYGIENRLELYGEITPYTYSDMNGYGHFVKGLLWISVYWLAIGGLLAVLAIVLARRGTETHMGVRLKLMGERFPRMAAVVAVCALTALAAGGWFYYNAHVLNVYRTTFAERHRQAEYEKRYKKYEKFPQPKITDVEVAVDIFPEKRSFTAAGHYMMVNRTDKPIEEIHVTEVKDSIDEIKFDRPSKIKLSDKDHFYEIYTLESPLQPGEAMRMDFRASAKTRGFKDGGERPELAYNGTFFDRDYFPLLGYSRGQEIDNPVRRREEKLGDYEELAQRGDPYWSNINLFTTDSEWVTFNCVVSTSPDQIAIAPGYLTKEWTENGRRYFAYDMGEQRINNFYSFLSGRFEVKKDKWKNVNLEVYYTPGHEFNLDKMMESAKAGLDYYEKNFGPFQFTQYRVLEFPRYRDFAQSFPNTVPFSEGIGFIERMKDKDDLDLLYFVNAHELAHQWWGHQLIGSMTQGSNMMSETLAEYSALQVMNKKYGEENTRKYLKYELDRYLRGRAGEVRNEPPLALVQNEPYVWYYKGALVMYALSDYIGEDKLNAALRGYLEKNRYATGPYPDTRGFVDALREATPPELQYVVDDMFNSIVLYENKATTAVVTPDAGKYKITLNVETSKRKADGSGNETPMAINDFIDVGVFSGTKEHLKKLYMEKRRFNTNKSTVEVIVDEKPTYAGIDPYNKLIDRNPEDNLIEVTSR